MITELITITDSSQDIVFENNDATKQEKNSTDLPIRIRGSFLQIDEGDFCVSSIKYKIITIKFHIATRLPNIILSILLIQLSIFMLNHSPTFASINA